MYNPFEPNTYHQIAEAKRRRIERQSVKEEGRGVGLGQSVSMMSADDIIKHRVTTSAALGIGRAVHVLTEMEETEIKAKLAAGEDRKSRLKSLLNQLNEATGGSSTATSSTHLEFQSSSAGHTVVTAASAPTKPPLTGKPSSCLLIRNLAAPTDANPMLIQSFAAECARFGVVKDIQLKVRPDGPEEEAVRLFVRFDTVSTAFKAGESLNGQRVGGRVLVVCFVPQTLIENQPLERQPWEEPVAKYM